MEKPPALRIDAFRLHHVISYQPSSHADKDHLYLKLETLLATVEHLFHETATYDPIAKPASAAVIKG